MPDRPPGGAIVAAALVGLLALAVPSRLYAANPTASVADLTLPSVMYSHADQTSAGTMTLSIDSSTNAAGWSVTILASGFAYSGPNSGSSIAASNFSLTSAAAPVMTSGQAVDAANGPKVPTTSPVGTLDTARKTVQANEGYGEGTYTQALGVTLTIPGGSRVGTYTATLTTTASVGP